MATVRGGAPFTHALFNLTRETDHFWMFALKPCPMLEVDPRQEIKVRKSDRMIHGQGLTAAASNGKKRFESWFRLDGSKAFIAALERSPHIGVPRVDRSGMEHISVVYDKAPSDDVPGVVKTMKTGPVDERGVWIHPKLVNALTMWISPDFHVQAMDWVDRILAGDITMMEVVRDAHDAVHGTTTTVAINTVCESRKRPNYVVPDRTLPPSMRVIAKDTQHMLGDFVDSAVAHKDDVGKIMMFLGDKACEAATGQNAGALKRLNGVKNGSARDLMNEEQLENVDYFMRKVMRRAIAAGDGRDFHEIAVSVKRDMETFVAPPSGPTPLEVVKKNKEDMRKDLLLTRPLNLERFYRRVPKLDSTIKGVRDLSGP
eukprot:jgi/Mesvir1/9923/Mv26224-RA.1